jgi:hypothetical protein
MVLHPVAMCALLSGDGTVVAVIMDSGRTGAAGVRLIVHAVVCQIYSSSAALRAYYLSCEASTPP